MKQNKTLSYAVLAGTVTLGVGLASTALAGPKWAKSGDTVEKCLGVSVKGQNDCGSKDGSHKCGGKASTDRSPNEWVYTPEGLCAKLGGTVWKTKKI